MVGRMEQKRLSLSHDSTSAAVFSIPGIWLVVTRNWNLRVMNARHLRRCMTFLSLLLNKNIRHS